MVRVFERIARNNLARTSSAKATIRCCRTRFFTRQSRTGWGKCTSSIASCDTHPTQKGSNVSHGTRQTAKASYTRLDAYVGYGAIQAGREKGVFGIPRRSPSQAEFLGKADGPVQRQRLGRHGRKAEIDQRLLQLSVDPSVCGYVLFF